MSDDPGQQPPFQPPYGAGVPPYQHVPMYAQPPAPKQPWWKNKMVAVISSVAAVLVLLMACCTCSLISRSAASVTSTAQGNTYVPTATSASSTPAAPTATSASQTWQTVQQFSGNGNQQTDTFHVSTDTWHLAWTCDPSSFSLGSYNVIASVYGGDGSVVDFAAINTMCQDGNTSGVTTERTGAGDFYLDIQSEAAWTFSVQVLQ